MKSSNESTKTLRCSQCNMPLNDKPYILKGKAYHTKECAENYKCMGRQSSHGHDCCG